MAKVLVCGSEGSLMQAVIPKLISKGHLIIGVDNLIRYGKRSDTAGRNYLFYPVDLTDRVEVDELFSMHQPDYVIQAAARIYGVGGFNKYCADILGEDISLHNNVLRASMDNGTKKVIYISSSMVYENCPPVEGGVREDMVHTETAPYTDYGLSKFVGERLSMSFFDQYKLPYTIWRPFNIITPFEKADSTETGISHVFADFIKNIVVEKKNPLPIIGDGNQIRCFTWIDEVAQAIADWSLDERVDNGIYNLGNAEPITMRELAEKIKKIAYDEFGIGDTFPLHFSPEKAFLNDVKVRIPNVIKAKRDLGWEAKVRVDDSIRECIKNVKCSEMVG